MSQVLLLLLTVLFGADVKVVVPDSAEAGQPVLIDASESIGDLTWDTADPDLVIFPAIRGGKQAYVQRLKPGNGRFTVTAKDAAGTSRTTEILTFTPGDIPSPAPSPMPDVVPGPQPKLPDGKFRIAQGTHDEACKVKVSRKEQRRLEAQELATKLAAIRDRVKSGELDATKPQVMLTEIQRANKTLPADVQSRWAEWGNWWGKFLYGLWTAGKLVGQAEWLAILEETILGLKAVF